MDLDDPVAVALAVADALREDGIPHALYGGLLLAAYGTARETKDVDLAVVHGDVERVAASLDRRLGLQTLIAFDRQTFGGLYVSRVTLVEGEELNTLDLVEPRDDAYAERALGRSVVSTLRTRSIRVLAPEDFVVFKLLSSRALDLDDARSVVRVLGAELDRELVEAEADRLASVAPSVAERWRAVFGPPAA